LIVELFSIPRLYNSRLSGRKQLVRSADAPRRPLARTPARPSRIDGNAILVRPPPALT
jgi:hypothetical protein